MSSKKLIEELARKLTHDDWDKVRRCLDLLQEAQSVVMLAAQSLCSVPGFADEWEALDKPYEAVKAHWYKIAGRRDVIVDKARELGLQKESVSHGS